MKWKWFWCPYAILDEFGIYICSIPKRKGFMCDHTNPRKCLLYKKIKRLNYNNAKKKNQKNH